MAYPFLRKIGVFINARIRRLHSPSPRFSYSSDRGYFRGKNAICSVTTGAPEAAFKDNGRGGNIEIMLWSIQYSLYYMGFTVLSPFLAYGVQGLSGFVRVEESRFSQHLEDQKAAWARRLEHPEKAGPVSFPGWDDWDEYGHPISIAAGVAHLTKA